MSARQEIKEITFLQSFGIFLVVLGHSYVEINTHPEDPVLGFLYWLHHLIYSFHMPLFMFISGLLFFHTGSDRDEGYFDFISGKFKRLILPYVIISTIAFPVKAVLSKYAMRPVDLSLFSYVKNLIYPEMNAIFYYWFLPTLFLIFLCAPLLGKLISGRNSLLPLLSVTAVLILLNMFNPFKIALFNVKAAIVYMVYFWLGGVFSIYRDRLADIFKRRSTLIIALLLLVSLNLTASEIPLLRFTRSIIGIAMSLALAYRYAGNRPKWSTYIDGYYYQIYLLQWFPLIFVKIIFFNVLGLGFYIPFVLMLSGGILVPVQAVNLIRRYVPRAAFIVGLRPEKKDPIVLPQLS